MYTHISCVWKLGGSQLTNMMEQPKPFCLIAPPCSTWFLMSQLFRCQCPKSPIRCFKMSLFMPVTSQCPYFLQSLLGDAQLKLNVQLCQIWQNGLRLYVNLSPKTQPLENTFTYSADIRTGENEAIWKYWWHRYDFASLHMLMVGCWPPTSTTVFSPHKALSLICISPLPLPYSFGWN